MEKVLVMPPTEATALRPVTISRGLSGDTVGTDNAKSLTKSGGLTGVKNGGGLGGTDNGLYHSEDHYENMGDGTAPITGLPILLDLDGDGIEIARRFLARNALRTDLTRGHGGTIWEKR